MHPAFFKKNDVIMVETPSLTAGRTRFYQVIDYRPLEKEDDLWLIAKDLNSQVVGMKFAANSSEHRNAVRLDKHAFKEICVYIDENEAYLHRPSKTLTVRNMIVICAILRIRDADFVELNDSLFAIRGLWKNGEING